MNNFPFHNKYKRIPYGCSIYLTTCCTHACRHCYLECNTVSGMDMPEQMLLRVIEKSSKAGLLKNVTIVGGEPFIDTKKLLWTLRQLLDGHGILELFIPTNGRWVLADDYLDIGIELEELGRWVPYELRVAFSDNQWNIEQLGDQANIVLSRWLELESIFPSVFRRRELLAENMSNRGRAKSLGIARPGKHVGAHCSFDDWVDPFKNYGFYSDYLSFWPDGTCRACYAGGPVLGTLQDEFDVMFTKRAEYLFYLRESIAGSKYGSLAGSTCELCDETYKKWDVKGAGHEYRI